ncbi:hypothetical protein OESDEN_14016 [Oesophagostomum dentatum]|uniref:F-box domain-containing protein n=1 Tax=Oesophagostomum dentatum TaxID=61180 RepID=A0A0B1SSS4_OESDE|nr:hypothetical protein OESDEN_14016 [Oesophagostomum dentatum]
MEKAQISIEFLLRNLYFPGTLAQPAMERLNRDVILHICSYLDLGELSSLAAVFPQLAPCIFRTLKNTAWAFKMRILPQYTSIGVFHERRSNQISLDNSDIQISLQDSLRMDMVLGAWKELRRGMRKHIPYELLYIACLDITQVCELFLNF